MLRECTDWENCILQESRADILTYPELYVLGDKHSIFPTLLGIAAGLGLGAFLASRLPDMDFMWLCLLYIFCAAAAIGLFELIWRWRGYSKSRKAPLPGNKFRVNGGVILDYLICGENNDAYLMIAEDDLRDAEGNPVRIQYPAKKNLSVRAGQRILIAYNDNGAYMPLRLTDKTNQMIPLEPPAYFQTVNWKETAKLPHPAVMDLDKKSYRMDEKEAEDLADARNGMPRGVEKLRYKKKVMFLSIYKKYGFNEVYMPFVRVCEYVGGELKQQYYFISNSVFLPEDTPYGKVIYKYSEKEESTEQDLNYFSLDHFAGCR